MLQSYPYTLVATVGGQPQIVTFTLDLLLRSGSPISEVIVVHPSPEDPRLAHTLACLRAEFTGGQYHIDGSSIACQLHSHVLRYVGRPLLDINDEVGANAAVDTLHQLIQQLKLQKRHVHLSISGGQRIMSLMAIAAALLNFDHLDHIWHLYSPREVREQVNEGTLMHLPVAEASVKLIEVPFVPLSTYFSQLPRSASEARTVQMAVMSAQERICCEKVLEQLTPRQGEVLRAFANGLTPPEVARELCLSLSTVDTHKTRILDACREIWNIGPGIRLDYRFLEKKFSSYFHADNYISGT